MIKYFTIFFLGIYFNSPNVINAFSKEEVNPLMASSFPFQKRDSVYFNEYKLIKKLYNKGEFSLALGKGFDLLKRVKKKNIIELELLTNFLIGNVFNKTKNYKKAKEYYLKADALFQELKINNKEFKKNKIFLKENYSSIKILFRIGAMYHRLNDISNAKFYYEKVINSNSFNSSYLSVKSNAYNNLSNIYFYSKEYLDYKKAEEYALKAINFNKEKGDKVTEAASTASLANIYLELKEYKKAKEYYLKAITIIEHNKDNKSLKFKEVFYDNLSWAMYGQKDYRAYDYLGKSYDIRDSLRDAEVKKIVTEIEAKHNVDLVKQVEAIKLNDAKKAFQKKSWVFGGVTLFAVLLFLFTLNYYKLNKKNLSLKLSQNKLLQQQKIEKLRSDSQTRILNATLDGKESERKQIAETLHDSVSTLLSSANLHLQASKAKFKGETPLEIDKTEQIIKEASETIRDLSHTLVSSILLKFGLSYAINDMAEKYSNSSITIYADIKNIERYQQNFEIKVYNIVQELVNNILKHSKAENASIYLKERNQKIYLSITDDGQGFDVKEISKKDGLGINQIEARIQMMKGKFVIKTEKKNGTKIIIELPIVAKERSTSRSQFYNF